MTTVTPGELICDNCRASCSAQNKWVVRTQAFGPGVKDVERVFCAPECANNWQRPTWQRTVTTD